VDSSKGKKFGTPGFFSPEHIRRKALTEASDLYGAGLLLYQLISGKRLLPNSKDNEAVVKAMKKRDLSQLNMPKGNLEKAITSVIKKSISYYRFFRYSNAEDMIHDISVILKAYGVNYPRLAVWQFLSDSNLADKEFTDKKQPIYVKAK
jgi:serine/threonine-protein kinase